MYDRYMDLLKKKGVKSSDVAKATGIPPSTFTDWKNGRSKPGIEKLQKICDYFDISIDYLTTGKEKTEPQLNKRDERDIKKSLEELREQMLSEEGLLFDGEPASPEAIESILSAMQIGMEIAKKRNKEKYTPKKYKKD